MDDEPSSAESLKHLKLEALNLSERRLARQKRVMQTFPESGNSFLIIDGTLFELLLIFPKLIVSATAYPCVAAHGDFSNAN
ncbi:hypothetical protein G3N59_15430 [Paraburkholderia sp. Ac-20340]|uniref:hypothetical protein n=1 Tax=Paraburkholderia sp. Ac-20340 TaxID=2703888 RepID=UPI00197CD29C|nr:hypothetical protein [Paraburkholderia sp. Ac-20340]MBN3854775.1 hypothetical protein [Paraburkholderia sp. Ac-20340]